jgi:uncharacterized membrane protein (UPF0127 family)
VTLRLWNETRGALLAERTELAERALDRMRGLLGRDGLADGSALVIRPCTSIHTFFMRFAIDVLFLDDRGRALRAIGSMRPFRLTRIYPRAACVAELPAGTLARSGTREGDVVVLEDSTSGV